MTCSLPVFILEVTRDKSMRRGGRMGVDVFVVLVLCLSKGLLILERGAKIPEEKKSIKKKINYSQVRRLSVVQDRPSKIRLINKRAYCIC